MTARLWILGADDPEMRAIDSLLRECGERVEHALDGNGARVTPPGMYLAAGPWPEAGVEATYLVECAWSGVGSVPKAHGRVVPIAGYGRPPGDFLLASALGQVISELARLGVLPPTWTPTHLLCGGDASGEFVRDSDTWGVVAEDGHAMAIPRPLLLAAAAAHCLGAAYVGKCPGVDPADLLDFRVRQRAQERWRQAGGELGTFRLDEWVRRVRYDITIATDAIACAPALCLQSGADYQIVADLRRAEPWPELPEAACSRGVGYVAGPIPESLGRRKLVCSGSPAQVAAFIRTWAPAQKLIDVYGSSERGVAGGYIP